MEDEEGIGLILARATELRLKITDCIDTDELSFPGEGMKDGTIRSQDKDFHSVNSSGDVEEQEEEEEEEEEEADEHLLLIRDALESLESQLAALQNLRQRQQYEKQVALSEIDYSRKALVEKLNDYKGKELQVLREASTFAGERVDYENHLLLPPYPVHPPPLSLGLDNSNGYLPHLPSKQKTISDENGFGSGHVRKEAEVGSPHGVVRFLGSVAKVMLPIIGVISILSASGYGPEIRKRGVSLKFLPRRVVIGKKPLNQCPPGKVLVIEDGEARCLVKERVELPFDSVLAKRDVAYGYG